MTTVEKLRTIARELAGEAWDYDHRHLCAQAYVLRLAAQAVMKQADSIQREDDMFADPPVESSQLTKPAPTGSDSPNRRPTGVGRPFGKLPRALCRGCRGDRWRCVRGGRSTRKPVPSRARETTT